MSIVDQQLVDIEIVTSSSGVGSELRLNYQARVYHLHQAFAVPKLDATAATLTDKVQQQWHQLTAAHGDRYLLVREVGYYSLWELARPNGLSSALAIELIDQQISNGLPSQAAIELSLQQASIWLFQELWLRLSDLVGARQLQALADSLLGVTPQVKSWVDLDQLLTLDPLKTDKLSTWVDHDFATFDRQLYHLTQRKLGQKFGTELTIDIIQNMPERLQLVLEPVLDI